MIKYPTSAVRCRQISGLTQCPWHLSYSRSVTNVHDIWDVYIHLHLTSSPLLPNFPSPQCVAGKFPISHSCPWYLWYSYDVAFIYDIRDVMFSFNLTLPRYYLISNFTHHPWHPWCQRSTSSQLISVMMKSPISVVRCRIMTHRHQISGLRRASQDHDIEHQISDLRRASQDHDVNTKFPHQSFRSPQCVAGSHSIV